jgi:predicted RNA binding protein YcfA (HicA-like mRNA interferase family)
VTRIAKLNDRFLSGGRLSFAELEALLDAYGFRLRRVSGSHHIYARDGIDDQPNVQRDGNDAKPYQVKQFRRIVIENELSLDDRS